MEEESRSALRVSSLPVTAAGLPHISLNLHTDRAPGFASTGLQWRRISYNTDILELYFCKI